ncbi:MAG: SDR family NAD(P)-dependent oxidoreductase [Planctomycetota bacterium]
MDLQLRDKIALITGASRGIGAATAKILAEEGADVVVCYHKNAEGAKQTGESVRRAGRCAWQLHMDVADPDSVAAAFQRLKNELDRIDVLILCAGESTVTPFEDISPGEWEHIVGVNLNGSFHVLQAATAWLSEGSSVVAVASVAGHTGVPHHAHYAAAKAGVINLTKSAARTLAPRVRVNCVAPGMTLTEMGRQSATALPDDYPRTQLLTHRYAEPVEIARTIAFVASPVAGFMTGATIDINGGRVLR